MEDNRTQSRTKSDSSRRFREQAGEDAREPADTTLSVKGPLEVSGDDEDLGGDPYNHTGRFKKNVR